VACHRAVVVEAQQLDDVADVGLSLDPARSRSLLVGEDGMGNDPSLRDQLGPDVLGEGQVGGVVAMEVADLPGRG
jgi:hypothetical protein